MMHKTMRVVIMIIIIKIRIIISYIFGIKENEKGSQDYFDRNNKKSISLFLMLLQH